jgi:uncharacterized protein YqgV (UPF0045/DUF77 family)
MIISAQISLYPLRQKHLSPAIEAVTEALKTAGLKPEIGPMSTRVTGEAEVIFASLQHAFEQAAEEGQVVMTVTVSNACPA